MCSCIWLRLWRHVKYWQRYHPIVLFICSAISSSEKCLHVSKTESYGHNMICFEMTRKAAMPSSSEKCLAYPKQRATLLVRSVLKWRARPQCLRRRRDFVLQMNNTYKRNVFVIKMNMPWVFSWALVRFLPQMIAKQFLTCEQNSRWTDNWDDSLKTKETKKCHHRQLMSADAVEFGQLW
jgi:hypothetical protein